MQWRTRLLVARNEAQSGFVQCGEAVPHYALTRSHSASEDARERAYAGYKIIAAAERRDPPHYQDSI